MEHAQIFFYLSFLRQQGLLKIFGRGDDTDTPLFDFKIFSEVSKKIGQQKQFV